ncbi:MAG TPA: hypothetical protein VGG94_01120 [Chthoniobacterales bacterium]
MTNCHRQGLIGIRHSVIHSSFVIRHSAFAATAAFTIIELLVVISIIIVLAGLILGTSGYVQKKGARSRAEAEIAALSAACESYKADNGLYPRDNPGNNYTDSLDARSDGSVGVTYQHASQYLYGQLNGDLNFDGQTDANARSYFNFKPQMLGRGNNSLPPSGSNPVNYIRDPFGNSYGYSTAYQADIAAGTNPPRRGYNPTFDLWSTAGTTTASAADQAQWIKNW